VVKRPFHPGIIDSTHTFDVHYRIGEKEVAHWFVDTRKSKVTIFAVKTGAAPKTAPSPRALSRPDAR